MYKRYTNLVLSAEPGFISDMTAECLVNMHSHIPKSICIKCYLKILCVQL